MKKNFILTLCFLLVSFAVFAGKFILIPVTETNNFELLFNNNNLKIHYYCDNYVLATSDVVNYANTVVLDENAFADVSYYAIVYCFEQYKEKYLSTISKNDKILYVGDNFLIMKIFTPNFMPAKNDGMTIIKNEEAFMPRAIFEFPVITEIDPLIQSFYENVNTDTLMAYIQLLQDYGTRAYDEPEAYDAQDWMKTKFENWGLEVEIQNFNITPYNSWSWNYYPHNVSSGNVIAVQKGLVYPDEYIVCGAHYDSWSWMPVSNRVAPGADDNATGTASILEMARILSQYEFDRTIIYCCFSAEEFGLWGSDAYATRCKQQNINILGYFNIDMSGYLTPGDDIHISLIYPNSAKPLADYTKNVNDIYFQIPIISYPNLQGGDSDHTSFNKKGFMGVWTFEDWEKDSPFIHGPGDTIGTSVNNPEQVTIFAQLNLACMATLASFPLKVIEYHSNINIYPNPTTGELRITNYELGVKNVEIFDTYGRKLITSQFSIFNSQFNIDISHLTAGIYFVKIYTGTGEIMKKVVKL